MLHGTDVKKIGLIVKNC